MVNIKESGRSMIEMLGVLAIVGVLSVGALEGYSMAMERYRSNKIVYRISEIVSIINDLCNNGDACDSGTSLYSAVVNSGQIPDEEIEFSMIHLSDIPSIRISSMQYYSGQLLLSFEFSDGNYASICRKMLKWVNNNAYAIDFDGEGDMDLQYTYSINSSNPNYQLPISTSNIATYCKQVNTYLYMDVLLK